MTALAYSGPEQVVPEMRAQTGTGTLILRPGETYEFDGTPPGNPAWWSPAKAAVKPPAAVTPVPASVPEATQEG